MKETKRCVFRTPDGRELEVSQDHGVARGFCRGRGCLGCPLNKVVLGNEAEDCTRWVLENPQEAARLMGLEVLRVEGGEPFLLNHFGVRPHERFHIEGEEGKFMVNDWGWLMRECPNLLGDWERASLETLYRVLDAPWLVKKIPQVELEESEIETLKKVLELAPKVKTMGLIKNTDELVFWDERGEVRLKMPREGRFPMLNSVKEVGVQETVRRAEEENRK